jgi:Na+-translocating ferredoxin:NAD+ oxidoreductase RnfD subunit
VQNLGLVLLVFAFVCFVIACFNAAAPFWNKLVAAGLAFLVAAELFGGLAALHIIR